MSTSCRRGIYVSSDVERIHGFEPPERFATNILRLVVEPLEHAHRAGRLFIPQRHVHQLRAKLEINGRIVFDDEAVRLSEVPNVSDEAAKAWPDLLPHTPIVLFLVGEFPGDVLPSAALSISYLRRLSA